MRNRLIIITLLFWISAYSYGSVEVFVKIKSNSAQRFDEFDGSPPLHFKNKELKRLADEFEIEGVLRPFAALKDKELNNVYVIRYARAIDVKQFITSVSQLAYIEYAEPVPQYNASIAPNDPGLAGQWHLQKIHAADAWNIATGTGPVVIAVVDDGVCRTHRDLREVIWQNPADTLNGVDDDANGYTDDINGYDVADGDNNPSPLASGNTISTHGTHVAGIAAASSNNGFGIASAANGAAGFNKARIMCVKVQKDIHAGQPVLDNPYAGVAYAIAAGANIINMSWGGSGYSITYQSLFNYAHNQGIVLVAAAGNSNSAQAMYPASYQYVISVASTDFNDVKSVFSNFGTSIDICAPGNYINSCTAYNDSSFATLSGTSMACPLVASVCALIKLKNPLYTPTEVENCLKQGSDDISLLNPGFGGHLGAGRVNAFGALRCTPCTVKADFETAAGGFTFFVNSAAQFNALDTSGNTFKWQIEGNLYNGASISHTFALTGYYTVELIASSLADSVCSDTVFRTVTVIDSFPNICYPLEAGVWHFGKNAGIDFRTNPPSALANSPLSAFAGTTTVSDKCGNVLFFTDGVRVFDRSGNIMPNGANLNGDTLSYQVLAVPKPGSPGVYGLFTTKRVNQQAEPQQMQLFYSELDLNLAGNGTNAMPLGDVVVKGTTPLDDNVSQKMSVIRHANGIDFWFVIHDFGNNNFNAYLYDYNGLAATPVISSVGTPVEIFGSASSSYAYQNVKTYMKPSPDGSKLAMTHHRIGNFPIQPTDPAFELFDFDNSSGVVSNSRPLYNVGPNPSLVPYSSWNSRNGGNLEFSPDGHYLYGIVQLSGNGSFIAQFDITGANSTQINNSVVVLDSLPLDTAMNIYRFYNMQAGPDGKIYLAGIKMINANVPTIENTYLGVINNPDFSAVNNQCNYIRHQFYLGPNAYARTGMPTFAQYQLRNETLSMFANDTCARVPVAFNLQHPAYCDILRVSYTWNFGDSASGASNTSALQNPVHQFTTAGTYMVKATITTPCHTDSIVRAIVVNACQTCPGAPVTSISSTGPANKYCENWSTYFKGQVNSARYYKWVVDGADKALVDSGAVGNHSFFFPDSLANGNHTLCLVSYSDSAEYCVDSFCMAATIFCGPVTGLDEGTKKPVLIRQTGNSFMLEGLKATDEWHLSVVNLLGQQIPVNSLYTTSSAVGFSLNNVAAGVYLLVLQKTNMSFVQKVIVY